MLILGQLQSVSPDHGTVHVNSSAYAKFVTANHAATIATPMPESKFKVRLDNHLHSFQKHFRPSYENLVTERAEGVNGRLDVALH